MITCRHTTTIRIAGPSEAGETFKKFIQQQLIHQSPSRVIYVYGYHAPDVADVKHLYPTFNYVQGMKIFLDILPTIEADERNLVA